MRLELGELSQEHCDVLEADILACPATLSPSDYTIGGIEASFEGGHHDHRD